MNMNAFYFVTRYNLALECIDNPKYTGEIVSNFEYKPSLRDIIQSLSVNYTILVSREINANTFYIKHINKDTNKVEDCIYIIEA